MPVYPAGQPPLPGTRTHRFVLAGGLATQIFAGLPAQLFVETRVAAQKLVLVVQVESASVADPAGAQLDDKSVLLFR